MMAEGFSHFFPQRLDGFYSVPWKGISSKILIMDIFLHIRLAKKFIQGFPYDVTGKPEQISLDNTTQVNSSPEFKL